MAIATFYLVLLFSMVMTFKESWIGGEFFGLRMPQSATRWGLLFAGGLVAYLAFVCRVFMISGVEAFLLGVLVMPLIGGHVETLADSSGPPMWWLLLLGLAVIAHTLAERPRLGKAAVEVKWDSGENNEQRSRTTGS